MLSLKFIILPKYDFTELLLENIKMWWQATC